MVLRVLAAHRPPLCFVEGGQNGTAPIFSGYLIDLLPTLLHHAQLQAVYEITNYTGSGGKLMSDGNWTGVMGELIANRTDLALFPLTLTAQRANYIEHTQPYMDDGYGILVKTRAVDSGYSFLLPFEAMTWVMFLVAMLSIVLLITVLDSVTRRARLRAFERIHGSYKGQKLRRRDKLMNHAIETVMMAVGSGSAPTSRSWSVKIVFVAWAIFCVIMLSAYTANLTANMTVNQIGLNVKSLQDIAQMGTPFGVPADSSVASYFNSGLDQAAVRLRPKMIEYKSMPEGVEAVRDGKISAFINDYATLQFFTQEPPCNLALAAETVGSGQLVLGLPPNSTLAEALSTALLQLSEAGYMAELRRKWFVEASHCSTEDRDAGGSGQLHMNQAWSVFMILAAGAGVAIIAAALEVMYYRRFFAGLYEFKQDFTALGPRVALKKHISGVAKFKSVHGHSSGKFSRQGSFPVDSGDIEIISEQAESSQRGAQRCPHSPKGAPPLSCVQRYDSAQSSTIKPAVITASGASPTPQGSISNSGQPLTELGSVQLPLPPPQQQQQRLQRHVRLTADVLQQAERQQLQGKQQQAPFGAAGSERYERSIGGNTSWDRQELISSASDSEE